MDLKLCCIDNFSIYVAYIFFWSSLFDLAYQSLKALVPTLLNICLVFSTHRFHRSVVDGIVCIFTFGWSDLHLRWKHFHCNQFNIYLCIPTYIYIVLLRAIVEKLYFKLLLSSTVCDSYNDTVGLWTFSI